eukprot:Seg798.3 transcript_id=Seg798.3/GoldUCD/mRNA.D3Y31 product="Elongator complex protein 4" protein_id=Seg798.3/GoldUCD/D3Y31
MSAPEHVKTKMASSFKKKSSTSSSRSQAAPRGSKVSLHNNQLLVSSGVPSLDNILGGGIPVGSVLLVEEDNYTTFSDILLRYFVAEGILCGHGLIHVSANEQTSNDILKKLPAPVDQDSSSYKQPEVTQNTDKKQGDGELKIAWRYQNLPTHDIKTNTLQFGHYYDLTKIMDENQFTGIDVTKLMCSQYSTIGNTSKSERIHAVCKNIIRDVQNVIKNHNYSTSSTQPEKRILRIAVQSLGSPLWPTFDKSADSMTSLTWFLLALRAILRSAFAVCVVTIPTHLFEDPVLTRHLEQSVDNAVRLESFAGSEREQNPAFKDYDGLIHITKKSRINCLAGQEIDTSDWAFKLKRKKFSIEKLHLPPELSETANRAQIDTKKITIQSGMPLCSTNARTMNQSLDF